MGDVAALPPPAPPLRALFMAFFAPVTVEAASASSATFSSYLTSYAFSEPEKYSSSGSRSLRRLVLRWDALPPPLDDDDDDDDESSFAK